MDMDYYFFLIHVLHQEGIICKVTILKNIATLWKVKEIMCITPYSQAHTITQNAACKNWLKNA